MAETTRWICAECGDKAGDMTGEAFLSHLRLSHSIHETKGQKTIKQHLRGTGFSQAVYEWTISGKKFHQCVTLSKKPLAAKGQPDNQAELPL